MSPRKVLMMFCLLVLARAAFWPLQHAQEDAFITFRTARSWVESGVYGFNPGERVSVATSHAYAAWCALLRVMIGDFSLHLIHLANAMAAVLACRWLAQAACREERSVTATWVVLALWPVALFMSYSGMETSFVLLATAWLARSLRHQAPQWSTAGVLFLLPWLRPDTAPAGLLYLAIIVWHDRKAPWVGAAALLGGYATMLGFNEWYFGQWLNQSIVAKKVAYGTAFSPGRFASNLLTNAKYVFLPVNTKYLLPVWPLFTLVAITATAWRLRSIWEDAASRAATVFLAVLAWGLFAGYSLGGTTFPWYTWPVHLAIAVLGIAAICEAPLGGARRRALGFAAGAVLAAMMAAQWTLSVAWGSQEGIYRAGIGRQIAAMANPGERLMLEPLGYIPYYSRVYAICEVGLASPQVTEFRRREGRLWYQAFLRETQPEMVLVKKAPRDDGTPRFDVPVDAEGTAWFSENYALARTFRYDADATWQSPLLRRIARMGGANDYHLYRLRDHMGTTQPP